MMAGIARHTAISPVHSQCALESAELWVILRVNLGGRVFCVTPLMYRITNDCAQGGEVTSLGPLGVERKILYLDFTQNHLALYFPSRTEPIYYRCEQFCRLL
jgi:hypothetical protein